MERLALFCWLALIFLSGTAMAARKRGKSETRNKNPGDSPTATEMIVKFMKEHPMEVMEMMKKSIASLPDGDQEKQVLVEEFGELYAEGDPETTYNTEECIVCKFFMRAYRVYARLNDYEMVIEPLLVDICVFVLVAIDQKTNAKEMCPGVIHIQAPHAHKSITESRLIKTNYTYTTEDLCINFNACVPPTVPRLAPSVVSGIKKVIQGKPTRKRDLGNAIRVAQLTDIHLDQNYVPNTFADCGLPVCCQLYFGPGNTSIWGDYHCNVPQRTMDLFIEQALTYDPHFIIFSGDIPPSRIWEETLESQMSCTENLTSSITRIINGTVKVYPCIGNHETYPTNQFSVRQMNETVVFLDQFTTLWQPIAGFDQDQIDTIKSGGYYNLSITSQLDLLAINTNYMYSSNFYNIYNHKDNEIVLEDRPVGPPTITRVNGMSEASLMKRDVETYLQTAAQNNKKVLLVNHHVTGKSDYIVKESVWYEDLIVKYKDIIVLQIAGHSHADEYRLLFDKTTGVVQSMVFVSPSIDGKQFRNPSMRLYYLDPATYELLDYEQYYMDIRTLEGLGETEQPVITKLYTASTEYNLTDMSPESWLNLLVRFETDDALLKKHLSNTYARVNQPEDIECAEDCKLQHICKLKHATYNGYLGCIAPSPPPTTTIIWPTAPFLFAGSPPPVADSSSWFIKSTIFLLWGALMLSTIVQNIHN